MDDPAPFSMWSIKLHGGAEASRRILVASHGNILFVWFERLKILTFYLDTWRPRYPSSQFPHFLCTMIASFLSLSLSLESLFPTELLRERMFGLIYTRTKKTRCGVSGLSRDSSSLLVLAFSLLLFLQGQLLHLSTHKNVLSIFSNSRFFITICFLYRNVHSLQTPKQQIFHRRRAFIYPRRSCQIE